MNRTLPGPARDVALLIARLLLGSIMFAHGYQKLMIDGLGRTTQGFETMSIPVAIFSAAFVTVVEVVGGILVILGALLTVVAACYLVVMVGAAVFVHIPHGIFVENGGWELVGAISAVLLTVAAAGSGRYGLDHVIRQWQARTTPAPAPVAVPVERIPLSVPRQPVRHDYAARAAAFTEVFPRVSSDGPTPSAPAPPVAAPPVAAPPIAAPPVAAVPIAGPPVDSTPSPLPVRRRRSRPSPTPIGPPES